MQNKTLLLNLLKITSIILMIIFICCFEFNFIALIIFLLAISGILLLFDITSKENNKFDWSLRIIGIMSIIVGICGIEQSNHAGLAGAAIFIVSLPFIIMPIIVSLALKSWERLVTYILCLIACPYIALYVALPFYFYFRFMKNAYLKQIILYYVIPLTISSIIVLIKVPLTIF